MRKLLRIPIWNRKLLVVTPPHNLLNATRHFRMGRELINQVKNDPPDKTIDGCIYLCDKTGRYILWFPNRSPNNLTIIHETNHLVKHMMKYIGAQQEREAHAYTQEWICKEIRKILRIKTT